MLTIYFKSPFTLERLRSLWMTNTRASYWSAMAATTTIVQTANLVRAGDIDPEVVITPGIFVDRIVKVSDPALESILVAKGVKYPS